MGAQETLAHIAQGKTQLADLAVALGRSKRDAVMFAQALRRRGLIEIKAPGCYALTEAGSAWLASGRQIASGQGTRPGRQVGRGLRARAWWVLRKDGRASLDGLLSVVAEGREKDARSNLSRYLHGLGKAGILQEDTRNGKPVWVLEKNLGRKPPVIRFTQGVVFDPNHGAIYPMEGSSDA